MITLINICIKLKYIYIYVNRLTFPYETALCKFKSISIVNSALFEFAPSKFLCERVKKSREKEIKQERGDKNDLNKKQNISDCHAP